jgi:plasmid stability protein
MSNLTISVDDQLIKKARVRAIQQGTSLSAKVREFLQQYANGSENTLQKQREDATARLLAAMDAATAQAASPSPDHKGKVKLRDEIYAGDFRARDRGLAE